MRTLITGATGLLGGNLCYLFKEHGFTYYRYYIDQQQVTIPGVELIPISQLNRAFDNFDCIMHCAAKTNVEECEKNPADAFDVNVELTKKVVSLANDKKALMVYISTDAVYKDICDMKTENLCLNRYIYAQTKLEG